MFLCICGKSQPRKFTLPAKTPDDVVVELEKLNGFAVSVVACNGCRLPSKPQKRPEYDCRVWPNCLIRLCIWVVTLQRRSMNLTIGVCFHHTHLLSQLIPPSWCYPLNSFPSCRIFQRWQGSTEARSIPRDLPVGTCLDPRCVSHLAPLTWSQRSDGVMALFLGSFGPLHPGDTESTPESFVSPVYRRLKEGNIVSDNIRDNCPGQCLPRMQSAMKTICLDCFDRDRRVATYQKDKEDKSSRWAAAIGFDREYAVNILKSMDAALKKKISWQTVLLLIKMANCNLAQRTTKPL